MKNVLLIIFFLSAFSLSQEIAYTSFEEPAVVSGYYTDPDTSETPGDHMLPANEGQPVINYESIGGELGFSSYYYNSRDDVGLTDGDYVGVTDYTGGNVGSYPDGVQGFQISDTDGFMVTTLDTIDISSYSSVLVSIDYFLVETGWETNDKLRIWLLVDDSIDIDLLNTENSDIDDLGIEDHWTTLTGKVSGRKKLNIKFGLDCNAGTENLIIDNIHIYDGSALKFPPTIEDYTSSSLPPPADSTFKDTVRVYDYDGHITSAKLHYSVNSADTVEILMSVLANDSLYAAVIPADVYSDGDQVIYWVSAEDDSGLVTTGESHGFFAGTTVINRFKRWYDNTELMYNNFYVRASGIATVGDSVFSNTSMNFYIQDEEYAGVNIFAMAGGTINIFPGHKYTVTGRITHYGGVIEIMPDNPETDVMDEGEAEEMPQPLEVSMATLVGAGEELEGLLVRCINVNIVTNEDNDPWPPADTDENADILISDDGETSRLILHIDNDTDIPGTDEPQWPQHITGIFGQYDPSAPYTEGYQLIPRSINDFETATAIEDEISVIPDELILYHAYPNPFNPATAISFNVPVKMIGSAGKKLTIYNAIGQIVKSYNLTNISAGLNMVTWNGKSDSGTPVTSGIYFAVLRVNNLRRSVKLLLLK